MPPHHEPGLPPELRALIDRLARAAALVLDDDPEALLAGVVHERGTLEWAQVRMMLEQATGEETTDNFVSALLDRPSVFDMVLRSVGADHVAKLERRLDRPGRWLPTVVITRDRNCQLGIVEIPELPWPAG